MDVLGSGAEATIFRDGESVIKRRLVKRYRHPVLDEELRRSRTRREAKLLQKARVPHPALIATDRESSITMEFIEGTPLKQLLDSDVNLAQRVGQHVAALHDQAIIHGDLTTSNMLLSKGEVVLIDFGLSFTSHDLEHKAVDIHLFKQALESKHHAVFDEAYKAFLKGYRASPEATKVLKRLSIVEKRGRNKAKY
ncbi:Kae1-associated serine/threonine protein kinase [Candidatus Woesearchaeota archaeon]|nr:MAG: Kae1-associated serine/threonine protein kinase [Candidatus Woesearchaeota archaeon]